MKGSNHCEVDLNENSTHDRGFAHYAVTVVRVAPGEVELIGTHLGQLPIRHQIFMCGNAPSRKPDA